MIVRLAFAPALAAAVLAVPAAAQKQFIIADRNNDSLFRVRDLNNDGVLSDPGEVFLWFSAANAAGTPGPMNTTTQAVGFCRVALMGDQGTQSAYRLVDLNDDGDAQDVGESAIFVAAGNSAGLSFAFPTGAAFDRNCIAHLVNAGNASGPDAIYRLVDLNADGDAMDEVGGVHEASYYVGEPAFGPGNGSYSPQEVLFDSSNVGYLRNTGSINGIFRFEDIDGNGRADDTIKGDSEFTLFFDGTNASGIAMSAGFAIDVDHVRPGALYVHQLATGGVDQVLRIQDLNADNDAQDAEEAVLVWSYAGADFTSVDVVCLRDGDVLVSDNSSLTVARLHDGNADDDFLDEGEQTVYFASAGTVAQVRQVDTLCRTGDVNCDGTVNVADLLDLISVWGAADCTAADVACNGGVNVVDLLELIANWG